MHKKLHLLGPAGSPGPTDLLAWAAGKIQNFRQLVQESSKEFVNNKPIEPAELTTA